MEIKGKVEAGLAHAVKTNSAKQALIFLSFFFSRWQRCSAGRSGSTVWNYVRSFIFYSLAFVVILFVYLFLSCFQVRLPAGFWNCPASRLSASITTLKNVALMTQNKSARLPVNMTFSQVLLSDNCIFPGAQCVRSQWTPVARHKLALSKKQRLRLMAVSQGVCINQRWEAFLSPLAKLKGNKVIKL